MSDHQYTEPLKRSGNVEMRYYKDEPATRFRVYRGLGWSSRVTSERYAIRRLLRFRLWGCLAGLGKCREPHAPLSMLP